MDQNPDLEQQQSANDEDTGLAAYTKELHKAIWWRKEASRINRWFMNGQSHNVTAPLDMLKERSVIAAAVSKGDSEAIEDLLENLSTARKTKLILAQYGKYNKSILQLALGSPNRDMVFKALRIHMDKETKKEVALLCDNLGNHLLHEACSLGLPLITVQQILANFDRSERLFLIASSNSIDNNCLRMAAHADNVEVFRFLLKLLEDKPNMLSKCVFEKAMTFRPTQETVGHLLANKSTSESYDNLDLLLQCMDRHEHLRSFLLQCTSECTLLYSVMSIYCSDSEVEMMVSAKFKLLFEVAESLGVAKDLVDTEKYPEQTNMGGVLNAAAWTSNINILDSIVNVIPSAERFKPFSEKSGKACATPLHIAAVDEYTFKIFCHILDYFKVRERKQLLMLETRVGNNPILSAYMSRYSYVQAINFCLYKGTWLPKRKLHHIIAGTNKYGWTLLHLACIRRTIEDCFPSVLKLFKSAPGLKLSKIVQQADQNGNTVLHYAALLHHPDVIASLMSAIKARHRRALLKAKNSNGLLASDLCSIGDSLLIRYLEPFDDVGWTEYEIKETRSYERDGETWSVHIRVQWNSTSIKFNLALLCTFEPLSQTDCIWSLVHTFLLALSSLCG